MQRCFSATLRYRRASPMQMATRSLHSAHAAALLSAAKPAAAASASCSLPPPPAPPARVRRVVVTGLGCVTPLGCGADLLFRRLLAGDSGVARVVDPAITKLDLAPNVAAWVRRGSDAKAGQFDPAAHGVPRAVMAQTSPFIHFAMAAANMALADAKYATNSAASPDTAASAAATGGSASSVLPLPPGRDPDHAADRTGVCMGSGIGCVDESAEAGIALAARGKKGLSAYSIPKLLVNLAAGQISQSQTQQGRASRGNEHTLSAELICVFSSCESCVGIQHGFRGPNHAVATACTTGAHSIGDAFNFIRNDSADVMVAGSSEASVTPLSMALFARIRALGHRDAAAQAIMSPEQRASDDASTSRPFDASRNGFVMGEGAGALILEELEHARARGARIYAEVRGYGLSGDAAHITAPHAQGRGSLLCMRGALRSAGLDPSHIDYINAHATSTPLGDRVEAMAIREVFGEAAASAGGSDPRASVCVSSTKGALGHMLGAAGSVESLICVLAVYHDRVPPNLHLHEFEPEMRGLNYVQPGDAATVHRPIRAALSNSFGFGGTNASLIFTKYEEPEDDAANAVEDLRNAHEIKFAP